MKVNGERGCQAKETAQFNLRTTVKAFSNFCSIIAIVHVLHGLLITTGFWYALPFLDLDGSSPHPPPLYGKEKRAA